LLQRRRRRGASLIFLEANSLVEYPIEVQELCKRIKAKQFFVATLIEQDYVRYEFIYSCSNNSLIPEIIGPPNLIVLFVVKIMEGTDDGLRRIDTRRLVLRPFGQPWPELLALKVE
jgi:hypothetical protein